jgi:hypothetical protein
LRVKDAGFRFVLDLGPGYLGLLRHIQIRFWSADGLSNIREQFKIPPESRWHCDTEWIGFHIPNIFAEFQENPDGHANILTVMLDTKGNIFRDFSLVKWESPM